MLKIFVQLRIPKMMSSLVLIKNYPWKSLKILFAIFEGVLKIPWKNSNSIESFKYYKHIYLYYLMTLKKENNEILRKKKRHRRESNPGSPVY